MGETKDHGNLDTGIKDTRTLGFLAAWWSGKWADPPNDNLLMHKDCIYKLSLSENLFPCVSKFESKVG